MFSNRKHLSLIDINENDLIKFVKFIGRQHSFLTGIMDQINICYSFQVLFFASFQFQLHIIYNLSLSFHVPDDGGHWSCIYLLGVGILHVLSILHSKELYIQRVSNGTLFMGITLYSCNDHRHLHRMFSQIRST